MLLGKVYRNCPKCHTQMNSTKYGICKSCDNRVPNAFLRFTYMLTFLCYYFTRFAAEWIGELQNCPQDRLQAFAELGIRNDAFGKPKTWSKTVVSIFLKRNFYFHLQRFCFQFKVSIIGNILNGLSMTDIESIDMDKLYLNLYYRKQSNNSLSYRQKPSITTTATPSKENSTATNFSGNENIYT